MTACKLEFTDYRFVYAGKSYPNVPMLVNSKYEFVREVCEYFIALAIRQGLMISSLQTYAECILAFWKFLEENNFDFRDVTDKVIIRWLNHQEKSGVGSSTRIGRKNIIFDMYAWMESEGHVEGVICLPGSDFPKGYTPQLSSVKIKFKGPKQRAAKYGVVSGIVVKKGGVVHQPTPNSEDIAKLYVVAENENNPGLTDRNHLLIDWYVGVGLRREEWQCLGKARMPTYEDIHQLQKLHEAFEWRLTKTKGGNARYVGVLPDILERTLEYIDGPRKLIVERFKGMNRGYKEPDSIFLSEKTGLALSLTTISNMFTRWFKLAGVDGHGHRLRATFLCNLFDAEVDAEEALMRAHPGTKTAIDYELVLRKVAERAGHRDIESLKYYLNLVKKRRQRAEGVPDQVVLRQELNAANQKILYLERQLEILKEKCCCSQSRSSVSTSAATAPPFDRPAALFTAMPTRYSVRCLLGRCLLPSQSS